MRSAIVGILGGIDYLRDLNCGDNPIVSDPTIAEAWAQDIFSHYSQVSRTLDVADEQTYEDVLDVLRTISAPYIQQAVTETLVKEEQLIIDLDLTGRTVSPNSAIILELILDTWLVISAKVIKQLSLL